MKAKRKRHTRKSAVYTPIQPSARSRLLSRLAHNRHRDHSATCQTALAIAFSYSRSLGRGSAIAEDGTDLAAWWHGALAQRDEATIEALASTVRANNQDVAAVANGLDLGIKAALLPADLPQQPGLMPDRLLQFDALEMAKRIAAAAAQHKNRGARQHKGTNRHLAFRCPVCSVYNERKNAWSNTVRASNPSRLLWCSGTAEVQHAPTVMQFDESSQPEYRLQDKYAGAVGMDDVDNSAGYARAKGGTQSQIQLEASRRRATQDKLAELSEDDLGKLIPF